jgi:hypothetical protein
MEEAVSWENMFEDGLLGNKKSLQVDIHILSAADGITELLP